MNKADQNSSASKPAFSGEVIERVKLGNIGKFQSGGTPSSKHPEYFAGTIPWIGTTALKDDLLDEKDAVKFITEEAINRSATKLVPSSSILIGIRVGVGKIGINAVPMCTSQDIVSIVGIDERLWNKKYISLALQYEAPRLAKRAQGATITGITSGILKEVAVPARKIADQTEIVAELNSIKELIRLAKTDSDSLQTLVKSRFIEMFGDLDSDSEVELKSVCSVITDGTHQPPKFAREGIPFLFVSNIANNALTYETEKFVTQEAYRQLTRRTPVEVGDVLVSAVGSFGHPAVVRSSKPFCFQRHIAHLKPVRELVDSDYLHSALLADQAQRYMDQSAKGVAQRTVTLKSFKEMKIPLPSLEAQREFAAFARQAAKLEFVAQKQIEKLQLLYDSLAQEYFG